MGEKNEQYAFCIARFFEISEGVASAPAVYSKVCSKTDF